MKTSTTARLLAAAGLAIGVTLTGAVASWAADVTLKVTAQLPASHPTTSNLMEFKEIVEEKSGGEIAVEIYDSAQLYKDSEVPQAVSSGAVAMGTASLTRFAGTIPAVDFFYVPFSLPSLEAVEKATAPGSEIRNLLDGAIAETGAKVLWWQAVGGAVVMSNKPVHMPDDLKGMKVRVFGKTLGNFVELLGGAPALISGSEQFLAYQRGTVDAGMSSAAGVTSRKIYEVLDHLTVTNHADVEFVVLINQGVWDGLSDAHKAIVDAAAKQVEKSLRDDVNRKETEAIDFVRTQTKMEVITLDDEQLAAWKKASAPMIDKYIESSGDLGRKVVEAAEALQ
ncbi:TRAP transporter substrate-binding protein DctP [Hoeflea sp. AS16]|uniref:TRAP transporter substrate-binding protein n=1 Tax=unclassified Hoeflea TaxID=2614931 RepID=UPI003181CA11